ncbi:spore germination protein [Dehalobacterium formicoaceticum]|uniref:Spore germination protein n=1 Tax=Dehalobacterium formicoaceticum TaxID=51515 RepID=A0ABT1Y4B9_9FIRM|nr:spore germination protein [Dehalobacterium formicoaceticum]MCR6545728.1 spore germination protein [Dehalobacterium formicoaceticum]
MFRKFIRKIKVLGNMGRKKDRFQDEKNYSNNQSLSKKLQVNFRSLQEIFQDASDIVFKEFKIGEKDQINAFLIFVDGLVDNGLVNESLLKSLMLFAREIPPNQDMDHVYLQIKESALSIAGTKECATLKNAVDAILSGDVVLFLDGADKALILSIRGWSSRAVMEPVTETVVRGPREGFVETLRTNTSLIRRKIKSPNLKFESMKIGTETQTDICVVYMKNIVNQEIVQEVKKRLEKIEIDGILESGYIESFIEDAPFSIFPTVGNSEKPDTISAKILEGRVAILVDGTPFVLAVPYLLVEAFQNSEDYYARPFFSSLIRILRYISFGISILAPASYVAITTFEQELLPAPLVITTAASLEGVPFPPVIEALMMGAVFEILREAGVRLPRPVGQAVSIVGALVIGQSAVAAGFVGAPMVIVVALTAIASFVVPVLTDAGAIIRFLLTVLAGLSGIYGIMLGIAVILTHLCSLRSFGMPYTSPLAPMKLSDMKDVFIRVPWWAMLTRPRALGMKNRVRQKSNRMTEQAENDQKK